MHTPHPPRPSYAPRPGVVPGVSDENLAAQLRGGPESEAGDPVAVLMTRHWQSAYDYAVICLATSANVASMVTAASFHQVLEGLIRGESGTALRPRLLVTVRDMVKEWSAEDTLAGVLPDLRKPAGGRGMRAAKSMTPENRKLAERSFQALPGLAQCLLWHTEVEAEPITIPAGLLGMGPDTAAATLEQAREQFRQGCVRAHRELAPSKDCRFYNRLLDVPIRRGGALLPDVQQHLLECRYCRYAAEQLSHFEGSLGGLLAEAVLGWGARRYLDSRPDRAPQGGSGQGGGRRGANGGRHRLLSRIPPQRRTRGTSGPRGGRTLLTGVGAASGALVALVLSIALLSDDGTGADPAASTSATGDRSTAADPGDTPAPTSSAPPNSAGMPTAPDETRLRNLAADLCLDIRGGKAENGATTELAVCSSAWTQKWSYEEDGQLRSVANPELCLDSHVDAGVVILGKCVTRKSDRADDVRYDLTVQGELLPRWEEELAVAPTGREAKADIVVKARDGSDTQRWVTDGVSATPESLSIAGSGAPSTDPAATGTPLADGAPERERTGDPAPAASPESYEKAEEGAVRSVTDDTDLEAGGSVPDGDDTSNVPSLPLTTSLPLTLPGSDLLA
ncbi:RICIN domain-containing protein [Streptomyces phyllanthi]|uniref:Hydrolase n=1 Tax=Streptomyces phyllanthi TaxID=1803180 RepID=A0A5N8WCS6_9ACTN|nr:RICIN domain-containing protein [Streptomyces phyllanthi]MPY45119.1 hydrolase [Streptomyces phyllanthi]